jgi:hypothetical protein
MNKKIILSSLMLLFTCSCSMETKVVNSIVHEQTKKFIKNQDFNSEYIEGFKINDVVVVPFFRSGKNQDEYSLVLSAYSGNPEVRKITVVEYSFGAGENAVISEERNETVDFKPHWDDYWGEDILFAGMALFRDRKIGAENQSQMKLVIKVKIEDNAGEKYKELVYNFDFVEEKYLKNY